MPKHEASALRTSAPQNDRRQQKKRERGRGSVTWLWGPIILLGGGGWGWGEPWGPGGPCGTAQNKEGMEGDKRWETKRERGSEKWQKRGRERSRVTAGQRTVGAQEPKCGAKKMYKNKMLIFMYQTQWRRDRAEKSKQMTEPWMRGTRQRDGEDVCSFACQSSHQEACCMQHVISANFPELTVSIKLYAISFITTLNTGTVSLMLLIWQRVRGLIEPPPTDSDMESVCVHVSMSKCLSWY